MITASSSQLDMISSSSSPFARCIPNHSFNNLVASCIPSDNSQQIDYTDLWVHNPQRNDDAGGGECRKTHDSHRRVDKSHDHATADDGGVFKITSQSNYRRNKWATARDMVFPGDRRAVSSGNSPMRSDSLAEIPGLVGVSSLVQKWRGLEVEAKCSSSRRSSAGAAFSFNSSAPVVNVDDDMLGDWESDRTVTSGPPSSRGRPSDATESEERLRVSDIIKKLTIDDRDGCDSMFHVKNTSAADSVQPDQSRLCYNSPLIHSPRIRGRQALQDLLLQMERDKRRELQGLEAFKAVSKYSHRGRIQALLKTRFLRRGMEIRESRPSNGHPSDSSTKSRQSALCQIRERFDPSAQSGTAQSGNSCAEVKEVGSVTENLCSSDHQENQNQQEGCKEFMGQEANENHEQKPSELPSQIDDDHDQNLIQCEPNPASQDDSHQKPLEFEEPQTKSEEKLIDDCAEQISTDQNLGGVSYSEMNEVQWEETMQYDDEYGPSDWICEVSRPRSDWEGLRQARYQEMLDPFSQNDEIRVLLQRKNVSSFLSSGLREQIDRLMICRAQGQLKLERTIQTSITPKVEEEEEEEENLSAAEEKAGDDNKAMELLEAEAGTEEGEMPEEETATATDYYDDYEETDQSSIGMQYSNDFLDPTTSTNDQDQDQDYSYPSTQHQSVSSSSYSQEIQPNSFISSHNPNEVELLYDLKGHMEQLHQEISELRRSLKFCMNMQIKLQRSIHQEPSLIPNHSDAKKGCRNTVVNHGTGRRTCYICCKVEVDSLLYRCGHMCTCFDCGHNMQRSSGECPICRAPIMDIVRITTSHF